jgi:hypothetical protein
MIFGASRLADLGGSLGKGIKEFKKNVQEDDDKDVESTPPATAAAQNGDNVSAVRCVSCGTLNVSGSKFCTNCGAGIAAPVS